MKRSVSTDAIRAPIGLRRILASTLFLFGAVVLVWGIGFVMTDERSPKEGGYGDWRTFKSLPENSVDVLFVGNSHAHTTILPMLVWDEFDVTSWVLAAVRLSVPGRQAYLEEALKTQSPRVVVVEAGRLTEELLQIPITNQWAYEYMPWSFAKLRAMWATVPAPQLEQQLLAFQRSHQRYDELERDDVVSSVREALHVERPTTGGVTLHDRVWDGELQEQLYVDAEQIRLAQTNLQYLRNIAEICAQRDIELIFFVAAKHEGPRHSELLDWAQQEIGDEYPDVTWVDMHDHVADIGLVTPDDFRDEGHVNVWGAEKSTRWLLREHIMTRVDPSDVSGDVRDWWDSMAAGWEQRVEEATDERGR